MNDEPKSGRSIVGTWVVSVALILIFSVLSGLYVARKMKTSALETEMTARAADRAAKLAALQKEDASEISKYAWIDSAAGIVQIPVDRAMELEAAVLKNKPVRPAGIIPPEQPVPAPAAPAR